MYRQTADRRGRSRERGDYVERNKLPLLIRLFVWLLVFRSAANLIFALIVGLAPDSARLTIFVAANFDAWPKQMPPEAVFYISALLYGVTAWRWYSRDWRARWVVMFLSGATAAKMLANYVADHAAGTPTPMTPGQQAVVLPQRRDQPADLRVPGVLSGDGAGVQRDAVGLRRQGTRVQQDRDQDESSRAYGPRDYSLGQIITDDGYPESVKQFTDGPISTDYPGRHGRWRVELAPGAGCFPAGTARGCLRDGA